MNRCHVVNWKIAQKVVRSWTSFKTSPIIDLVALRSYLSENSPEGKFFPTKQDGHARGVQKLPLIYREIFKYGAKQHALFDPPEGWEGRLFLPIFVEFLRRFSCTLPRRNGLWWYCIRLPRLHAGQALSLPRSDSKIQNFPCLSLFIRSDTSNPTSTLLASSSLFDT